MTAETLAEGIRDMRAGATIARAERVPEQEPASKRRRHPFLMRSLLVALVVLVLANVGIQLNIARFEQLSDPDFVFERIHRCEELRRKPDVLFIGSSRTVFSTDAHLIDGLVRDQTGQNPLSCNAGVLGASIEQDYWVFKRFVDDGYAPKLLVENLWEQNINVNSVYPVQGDDRLQNIINIQNLGHLSDASTIRSRFFGGDVAGTLAFANWLATKLIPLYGQRAGILDLVCGKHHAGPCAQGTKTGDPMWIWRYAHADKQGFIPITDYSMAQLSDAAIEAGPPLNLYPWLHYELQSFKIGGHQADYLAKMADLARRHGTRVAFVVSPLHPIYERYFDRPSEWQMIMSFWRRVANQAGASFYDASHLPGLTNADFFDVQHLTSSGAEKYSTWLATAVVAPLLASS